MRFIALILSFCLTSQVLASPLQESLNDLIDQYEYQLTVEWDQQDPEFSHNATESFYREISKLFQNGLTERDIFDVFSRKSLSPVQLEALKNTLKPMALKAKRSDELAKIISEYSKEIYQNGASWNGSVIIMGGVGVIAAALLGYSIWFGVTHTCVEYDQRQRCGWYPNYYGGPSYYQCWVETYCVQYVRN